MPLICILKGQSLVGIICIVQSTRGGCALCVKSLGDSMQINISLTCDVVFATKACQCKYVD